MTTSKIAKLIVNADFQYDKTTENTNTTTTPSYMPDSTTRLIVDILFQIDTFICIYSASIHIFYFLLVFKIKELRNRNLFYVHNANLVSFLFNAHYLLYYNHLRPSFSDESVNAFLCAASELLWAFSKNLRTYSVALIALHRLFAAFRPKLYSFLNSSLLNILTPLLLTYLWAIFLVLISKFSFNTSFGNLYCYDGYSANFTDSVKYFVFNAAIGIALPTVFAIVAYVFISKRLKSMRLLNVNKRMLYLNDRDSGVSSLNAKIHVHSTNMATDTIIMNAVVATTPNSTRNNVKFIKAPRLIKIPKKYIQHILHRNDSKYNRNLTKQFLIMDVCEIVSCSIMIVKGMRYMFLTMGEYYNVLRALLRAANLLVQSFIPLIAIIYNPIIMLKLTEWKNRLILRFCFNNNNQT